MKNMIGKKTKNTEMIFQQNNEKKKKIMLIINYYLNN